MNVLASVRARVLLVAAPVLIALAAPATARTAAEWIAEGDQHYAAARLAEARKSYAAAVQAEASSFTALTRLSRSESELGELQSGDEQKRTWLAAVEHARAALKAAPDSASGHVWLAVALGRRALREGAKARLALSREIKVEVDRALQMDGGIGRAWHVRAVWNAKIAGLNALERMAASAALGGVPKGASFENAEQDFQKAIQLEPDYINHHLEYGRLLLDRGRRAEAKKALEKAASLAPGGSALDAHYQAEAHKLLAKLR